MPSAASVAGLETANGLPEAGKPVFHEAVSAAQVVQEGQQLTA